MEPYEPLFASQIYLMTHKVPINSNKGLRMNIKLLYQNFKTGHGKYTCSSVKVISLSLR